MNLSIKNVPPEVVAKLKSRARRNHRSLQGELLAMAERTANELDEADADERERDIQHLVDLMRKGLPIGDRRFTRDKMHGR